MRNISCFLTQDQVRARTKFVTRRLGWKRLKPGTLLRVVVKAQGLKKGQKIEPLAIVRVADVRLERLHRMHIDQQYGRREVDLEGFPTMQPIEFIDMFCKHMGCERYQEVTRIKWSYEDRCVLCGCEIAAGCTHCGECTCEEDSL